MASIKSLGKEYIVVLKFKFSALNGKLFHTKLTMFLQRQVCAHLKIRYVEEIDNRYRTICTECEEEIEIEDKKW